MILFSLIRGTTSATVAIAMISTYFNAMFLLVSASINLNTTPAPHNSLKGYVSSLTFASNIPMQSGNSSGALW